MEIRWIEIDIYSPPIPPPSFLPIFFRIIVGRADAAIVRERSKAMEPFVEDLLAWEVPSAAATAPQAPTMAEKVSIRVSFSAAATKTI